MIKELQERVDIWYEEEGKDMLPIKESLEVAWSNGAYVIQDRTCESCRWYQEQYNDRNCKSDTIFVCKLYDIAHGKDFGCNKWEKKDD